MVGRPAAVLFVVLVLLMGGCGGSGESTSSASSTGSSTRPWATTTTTVHATSSSGSIPTTTTGRTTTSRPQTTDTVAVPAQGKEIAKLPTNDKVVALTFDASYDAEPLKAILAALEEAKAQGSFFLTGEFVRDFPEAVRAIKAAGYAIGNHSYSHPDFLTVSEQEARSQIRRTAAALTNLGVADPRPLFRFPYGSRNSSVLKLVASEGYLGYYWTIDTLDWEEDRTPQQVHDTVLAKLQPGAIVLMHVGSRQTAEILPQILADLKERGYKTVGLREALSLYGIGN